MMDDDANFLKELGTFVGGILTIIIPVISIWFWNNPFKLELDVITRLIATIGYFFILIIGYIKYTEKKLNKKIKKLDAIIKEVEVGQNVPKK